MENFGREVNIIKQDQVEIIKLKNIATEFKTYYMGLTADEAQFKSKKKKRQT